MDLRKIFPIAMQARNVKGLVMALLFYAVLSLVGGFLHGLVGGIPLVGAVIGFVGWALGIYCTVGFFISVFVFLNLVK